MDLLNHRNRTEINDAKSLPTGSGTETGYRLEVRMAYSTPKVVNGMLLDNRWQQVHWQERRDGVGVPRPRYVSNGRHLGDLLTRDEAEAHRWIFICAANASDHFGQALCLETRLVECKVTYEYAVTPVAYIDAFDGRGDLPADMKPRAEPADPAPAAGE